LPAIGGGCFDLASFFLLDNFASLFPDTRSNQSCAIADAAEFCLKIALFAERLGNNWENNCCTPHTAKLKFQRKMASLDFGATGQTPGPAQTNPVPEIVVASEWSVAHGNEASATTIFKHFWFFCNVTAKLIELSGGDLVAR
jgi:hypothetical protein